MSFLKRVISSVAEVRSSQTLKQQPLQQQLSAPRRVLVVNSKGGCGKTTIATNLAGCLSSRNHPAVLIDYDPQGSSMQWLSLRSDERKSVHGIAAHRGPSSGTTRSFQMRIPEGTQYVIVDAPAGVCGPDLIKLVRDIDTIIIPVLPSPIDIHACSYFIKDLFLVAKVRSKSIRIGVVANRTRANNKVYDKLIKFLRSLEIEFVGALKDSQSYVHAAQDGLSVVELRNNQTSKDKRQWNEIINWLNAG
ncbi:MAG: ParA family protein [Gammaproteobacteria bacterium]|nr:ParA family protein [Gammaproteobacteria bacterium]